MMDDLGELQPMWWLAHVWPAWAVDLLKLIRDLPESVEFD